MTKEKQIESSDWLTEGYSEEELARIKAKAIEEAEAELRETQIEEMEKDISEKQSGGWVFIADSEYTTDIGNRELARHIVDKGYRLASDVAEDIIRILRAAGINKHRYPVIAEIEKKYLETNNEQS